MMTKPLAEPNCMRGLALNNIGHKDESSLPTSSSRSEHLMVIQDKVPGVNCVLKTPKSSPEPVWLSHTYLAKIFAYTAYGSSISNTEVTVTEPNSCGEESSARKPVIMSKNEGETGKLRPFETLRDKTPERKMIVKV